MDNERIQPAAAATATAESTTHYHHPTAGTGTTPTDPHPTVDDADPSLRGQAKGAETGTKARGGLRGLMNKTEELRAGANKFFDETLTPQPKDTSHTNTAGPPHTPAAPSTTATGTSTQKTGITGKTEELRHNINGLADETLTPSQDSAGHAGQPSSTHRPT